jgi:transcriptional regulator GlxA family with amidase domain
MIPFLNEQAIRKNNPRAQRFYYILDYIDKNLGKKLDVHTLAEMACLQKNYFISLFKERYGLPPAKYINKRRIEVAQKELIASDENLEQLAFKLGFFDAFHFSKVFKSFTGRSPKNYKKEVMQHRVKKDIEKY